MVSQYFKIDQLCLEFQEIVGTKEFHDLTDACILKNFKWGGLRKHEFSPTSKTKSLLEIVSYKTQ